MNEFEIDRAGGTRGARGPGRTRGRVGKASMAVLTAGVLVAAGCSAPGKTTSGQAPASGAPAAASVAPLAATVATSTILPAAFEAGRRTITAQGAGTITGTPDLVTIVLGVDTRSTSANAALEDNNKRAQAVLDVLKTNGVAAADLQTSQLSINPSYDQEGKVITGYTVTNMVTAKVRKIATAGPLIDAVGKAAGNAVRVQQLSFSIDDDSSLRAAARANAVKKAQAQAKQMADAAGVQLGLVHSIAETPSNRPVVYEAAMGAPATTDGRVPLEKGSQQLSVVVQVVYEIAG